MGILAIALIHSFGRNTLGEYVDQVLSHIQYTQSLAMSDSVYDPKIDDWNKDFWQICFQEKINKKILVVILFIEIWEVILEIQILFIKSQKIQLIIIGIFLLVFISKL